MHNSIEPVRIEEEIQVSQCEVCEHYHCLRIIRFLGRFSVRLYIPPPLGHPARPEAQSARPEAQPARSEAQPASQPSLRLQAWLVGPQAWLAHHSTGLCPLSGPLPCLPP